MISRKIVDEIILVPAGEPLLRESAPKASGALRLEMCRLAISDLPSEIKSHVSVSNSEITRTGPSYAIDTFEELAESKNDYYWIIGSDAYEKIDNWHRAKELKEKVSFIVIERPSESGDSDLGIDIGALDISATQVRQDSEVHGVSPSVRRFIQERKLYASK